MYQHARWPHLPNNNNTRRTSSGGSGCSLQMKTSSLSTQLKPTGKLSCPPPPLLNTCGEPGWRPSLHDSSAGYSSWGGFAKAGLFFPAPGILWREKVISRETNCWRIGFWPHDSDCHPVVSLTVTYRKWLVCGDLPVFGVCCRLGDSGAVWGGGAPFFFFFFFKRCWAFFSSLGDFTAAILFFLFLGKIARSCYVLYLGYYYSAFILSWGYVLKAVSHYYFQYSQSWQDF